MIKFFIILTLVINILLKTISGSWASSSEDNVAPISINVTQGLVFGDIIVPVVGTNTYTIDSDGSLMDDYLGPVQGNDNTTHQITGVIVGQPFFPFTCSVTSQKLKKIGGNIELNFTLNTDNICDSSSSTLDNNGNANFETGGSLDVSAGQSTGLYGGEIQYVVTYQ